jgi:hypothetical protein
MISPVNESPPPLEFKVTSLAKLQMGGKTPFVVSIRRPAKRDKRPVTLVLRHVVIDESV